MIVVTGAAGFIGSCIVKELNDRGIVDIILVDDLDKSEKWKNLVNLKYKNYVDSSDFLEKVCNSGLGDVDVVIHMGACSSTREKDSKYLMKNNFEYSKILLDFCNRDGVRFIYASSAATYGDGVSGYKDDESKMDELKPLNMYGYSKKLFDQCVLSSCLGVQCVGLKFFNVFGPNEYHKGSMASMVYHGFRQVVDNGKIKLFESNDSSIKDGDQSRDFVYIKDVVSVVLFFMDNSKVSGIFNVGTGKSRTFNDLARSVFKVMGKEENIEYFKMQDELSEKYQNFTESDIGRLINVGYNKEFYSLEEGVKDYVLNYLEKGYKYYDNEKNNK